MIMMAEQLRLLYSVGALPRQSLLLQRRGHVTTLSEQRTGRHSYLRLRPCANSRDEAHQGSHGGHKKEDGNRRQMRHLTVAKALDTAKAVVKFARTNFLPLGENLDDAATIINNTNGEADMELLKEQTSYKGVTFFLVPQGGGHKSFIFFGDPSSVDIQSGKLLR